MESLMACHKKAIYSTKVMPVLSIYGYNNKWNDPPSTGEKELKFYVP
jgi:hypothetical protein